MLTRDQFRGHLFADNKNANLGGRGMGFSQSSMVGLDNAVNAYNNAATAANLLGVFVEIGRLPPVKKIKYRNTIEALQRNMPTPIKVTSVNPFTLDAQGGVGIAVPMLNRKVSHQTDAILALQELSKVPRGNDLLQAINSEIARTGNRVGVSTWDAQNANKCRFRAAGDGAKNTLAAALRSRSYRAVGIAISHAMTWMGHLPGQPGSYEWLQNRIDATPVYRFELAIGGLGSHARYGGGWISAAMIRAWVEGTGVFPAPLGGDRAKLAELVLAAALAPGALKGPGGDSQVCWSAESKAITLTNEQTLARPPYIALAHELIHAYHNIRGDQPGHEIDEDSTVLYEYLCVGLGPWDDHRYQFTENAIRASAGLPKRVRY
jgi:hypothetical protein